MPNFSHSSFSNADYFKGGGVSVATDGPEIGRPQVHKIAAFEDWSDHRMTEDEFAHLVGLDPKELKKNTLATGKVDCPHTLSAGNLVGNSSVVVTVMHTSCNSHVAPEACYYVYQWNGITHRVKIKSAISGETCNETGEGKLKDQTHDWAVLTLDQAVDKHIRPYLFNRDKVMTTFPPRGVINIQSGSVDYCLPNADQNCVKDKDRLSLFLLPRTVQMCTIRYIGIANKVPLQFLNDCAGSLGASGSAIVNSFVGRLTLLGMITNVSGQTPEELAQELKSGHPNILKYDDDGAHTVALPISGDLANAIEKAVGESNRTH